MILDKVAKDYLSMFHNMFYYPKSTKIGDIFKKREDTNMKKVFCDRCGEPGAWEVEKSTAFKIFRLDLCPRCKEIFLEQVNAYIKKRSDMDKDFVNKWEPETT